MSDPRHTQAFQRVLTMRARVDEADTAAFVRRTLREIHAYIREQDLDVAGPPFSVCHPLPDHVVDVEAGWPVNSAHGTERIHAGAIPATQLHRSRGARSPLHRSPVAIRLEAEGYQPPG